MPLSLGTAEEPGAPITRIDEKFRPVWMNLPPERQVALARYFLPHSSIKPIIGPTRPRVVKWYCPFAAQCDFPSGHRYCINVYTGCAHGCVYCYAASYEPATVSGKHRFERLITKDMEDLERFDVPAAPVHLSNSTDPFQPIEDELRHVRFALEQILEHRHRFTTVTVLTKDPSRASDPDYVEFFRKLGHVPRSHPCYERFARSRWPGLIVEVSLAFWREAARSVYDPGAPTVDDRLRGLR